MNIMIHNKRMQPSCGRGGCLGREKKNQLKFEQREMGCQLVEVVAGNLSYSSWQLMTMAAGAKF
jgi:hypothetical protein